MYMGWINKLIKRLDKVKFWRSVLDGEWRVWVFIRVVKMRVFFMEVVSEKIVLKVVVIM